MQPTEIASRHIRNLLEYFLINITLIIGVIIYNKNIFYLPYDFFVLRGAELCCSCWNLTATTKIGSAKKSAQKIRPNGPITAAVSYCNIPQARNTTREFITTHLLGNKLAIYYYARFSMDVASIALDCR